jgi:hypothetical protein
MNNTSRNSNHNSFHTDRERERDGDGGGFYTGHATGSPPTNISSSTSSFYNLQMYSTPSLYTRTTPTVIPVSTNTHYQSQSQQPLNLYQNVQEVLYHPTLDHRAYPVRSSPSPSAASTGSSSSGIEYNKVHKNGITFVDPFSTPVSSSTNDNYYHQQQQLYNQRNLSNINSIRNTTSSSSISNNVRTSSETVFQPIYATFGTESIFVTCPYCHSSESTEIEQVVGSKSFLWACIIPCAGFLRKSKWDTRHRCKNCLNVIGTYYP